MNAEANKSFNHGFILTEERLRRFENTILEQFRNLGDGSKPEMTYRMRFENGAIATTDSIDEVLSEENFGKAQIEDLRIKAQRKEQGLIDVRFTNMDLVEQKNAASITFTVEGDSTQWVFHTHSILQDRVSQV